MYSTWYSTTRSVHRELNIPNLGETSVPGWQRDKNEVCWLLVISNEAESLLKMNRLQPRWSGLTKEFGESLSLILSARLSVPAPHPLTPTRRLAAIGNKKQAKFQRSSRLTKTRETHYLVSEWVTSTFLCVGTDLTISQRNLNKENIWCRVGTCHVIYLQRRR